MELKTIDGWHKSGCGDWDTYCKPGELVDEGVADYFLDILPEWKPLFLAAMQFWRMCTGE